MAYLDLYALPPGVTDADELKSERGRWHKKYRTVVPGAPAIMRLHTKGSPGIHTFSKFDAVELRRWRETNTALSQVAAGFEMGGLFAPYYVTLPNWSDEPVSFTGLAADRGSNFSDYDGVGIRVGRRVAGHLVNDPLQRTVMYPEALGPVGNNNVPVDLSVTAQHGQLEHVATIAARPRGIGQELRVRIVLDLPAGHDVRIGSVTWDKGTTTRTSEVAWIGKRGTPRSEWIRLRRSFAWDTEVTNPDGSVAVNQRRIPVPVEFSREPDGTLVMTKLIPRSFLISAEQRGSYPVMTDALISPQAPTDDDSIEQTNATDWSTARSATTGTVRGGNLAYCREQGGSSTADVWRSYWRVDATAIGSGQAISAAVYYHQRNSYTDGGAEIDVCEATGPTGAPAAGDFDSLVLNPSASQIFASMDIGTWITFANNSYVTFTLDSDSYTYIKMVSGDTYFVNRMNGDTDDAEPGTASQIRHWTSNASGREQYMDITYDVAAGGGSLMPGGAARRQYLHRRQRAS